MNPCAIFASVVLASFLCGGCQTTEGSAHSDGDPYRVAEAYSAGKVDALRDIANGLLAVEQTGYLMKFDGEYVRLLKQRYGIEVNRVGLCIVKGEVREHAKGYNEVSMAEIERRFGKDCLLNVAYEAKALYESKTQAR